jgi:probable HAF family extracellular repeat protein
VSNLLRTFIGAVTVLAGVAGTHTGTVAAAPPPSHFTFQKIASPQDRTFTQLLGIDDGNTIAGYFGSGANAAHPNKGFTLVLPARFTSENFPASAQTQVIAIDNRRDTGGFYIDGANVTHGFMRVNGRFSTVDLPGTPFNQLLGLDNHGRAAGFFQDAGGVNHAWIRDAHGNFLVPPIANSTATGINDDGVVVGFTQATATTSSGFILRNNSVRMLSVPGSSFTQALGENDEGQVVGFSNDAQGNAHGFVLDHGAFRMVDVPGATSTTINGINNHGRIVGFFTDANGNTVGFVGTPIKS